MVSIRQTDLVFMKILSLTIVCALAVTGAAFAQGLVNWGSINFGAMTAQTNTSLSPVFGYTGTGGIAGATGSATTSGLSYFFELLYNTSFTGSQTAPPNFDTLFGGTWFDTGLTATNSPTVGRLTPVNPNLAATVPWAPGTTNNIMLVGWSANLGTSWATVSNELVTGSYAIFAQSQIFFGESATGFLSPNTDSFGAQVFGSTASPNGLPIYSLNTQLYLLPLTRLITPEPGTIALTGLGGLSLFLFRRRK
jgi:hypothetical protein